MFHKFLNSLKTKNNSILIEAIHQGYTSIFESGVDGNWYHGTNAIFNKFDKKKIGSQTDPGLFGRGFYFARTKNMAENAPHGEKAKIIKEVKLNLKNPLDIAKFKSKKELADHLNIDENILTVTSMGIIRPMPVFSDVFTYKLTEKGYDAVFVNRGGIGDEVVVFDPENILIIESKMSEKDTIISDKKSMESSEKIIK